jgi:hypothetical protein
LTERTVTDRVSNIANLDGVRPLQPLQQRHIAQA